MFIQYHHFFGIKDLKNWLQRVYNWVLNIPFWVTSTANLCIKFEWNRLKVTISTVCVLKSYTRVCKVFKEPQKRGLRVKIGDHFTRPGFENRCVSSYNSSLFLKKIASVTILGQNSDPIWTTHYFLKPHFNQTAVKKKTMGVDIWTVMSAVNFCYWIRDWRVVLEISRPVFVLRAFSNIAEHWTTLRAIAKFWKELPKVWS